MRVRLYSNTHRSSDLKNMFSEEISNWMEGERPEIVLKENSPIDREIDPFTLWFISNIGAGFISYIITKIFDKYNPKKIDLVIKEQKGQTVVSISSASELSKLTITSETKEVRIEFR